MKTWLLLLPALLCCACDDPDVEAKALSILEHGFVEAQAVCDCAGIEATFTKLIDGSCVQGQTWHPRSDPLVGTCPSGSGQTYIENGVVYSGMASEDVEVCCTGFNLEAFGAE